MGIEFIPFTKEELDKVPDNGLPSGLYDMGDNGKPSPVAPPDWDAIEASIHGIVSALFARPFDGKKVSGKAFLLYQNDDGTPGFAILEKPGVK